MEDLQQYHFEQENGITLNQVNSESFSDDLFESQWEDDDLLDISALRVDDTLDNSEMTTLQTNICISTISNEFTSAYTDADYPSSSLEPQQSNESMARSECVKTPESTSGEISQQCSSVDLEWEDDSQVHSIAETSQPKPVESPENWRTVVVGGKNYKLDMNVIQPYRQILSHGGYYGDGLNAIVVFSACYLPSTKMPNSRYIMDNLFLYIVSTLDKLVAHEYLIVFFSSGCTQENRPPFSWLKKCYRLVDKRLRKSLKQLVIVHPSWHIRLIINFFKPFLSSKFSRKVKFAQNLHCLADMLPVDEIIIPKLVQDHDIKLVNKKCSKKE